MTVAELIEELKKQPQDLPVVVIDGTEGLSFLEFVEIRESTKDGWSDRVYEFGGRVYEGKYLFMHY